MSILATAVGASAASAAVVKNLGAMQRDSAWTSSITTVIDELTPTVVKTANGIAKVSLAVKAATAQRKIRRMKLGVDDLDMFSLVLMSLED